MAKCHKIKAKITMIMVIFRLFMDIVEIGWVRVIYDGSGNFQVFSGFLWPKLRVPHCTKFSILDFALDVKVKSVLRQCTHVVD